jgi:hypothetical protein
MTVINPQTGDVTLATGSIAGSPLVFALDNGGFAVWRAGTVQRFDAFGEPEGAAVTLTPPGNFSASWLNGFRDVDINADGTVSAFVESRGDVGRSTLSVFRFDAQGVLLGQDVVVFGTLGSPKVGIGMSDGRALGLSASDLNRDGFVDIIYGQKSLDDPLMTATLATDIQSGQAFDIIESTNGRSLALWFTGNGEVNGALVGSDGNKIGATVNFFGQRTPQFAASGDGFVKVGFALGSDRFFVETYDASLVRTGGVETAGLTSFFTVPGGSGSRFITDVEVLPNGGVAVTYAERVTTNGGNTVVDNAFLRLFRADGTADGPARAIGAGDGDGAIAPNLTVLENGDVVTGWFDPGPTEATTGSRVQVLDVVYTEAGDVRTLDATTNQSVDLGVGTDHVAYATNRAGFQIFEPDSQGNAAEIVRLYDAFLGRAPDAGGFNFWLSQLDGGQSLGQIAQSFAASGEFQAYWGNVSNRAFVEEIYERVLERTGDKGGVDYWTSRVGVDGRASVLLEIASSAEAKALPGAEAYIRAPNGSFDRLENVERVVFADGIVALDLGRGEHTGEALRMYDTAFDRGADRGGLTYWTRQLDAGLSLKDMAQAFINSAEGADLRTASNTDFVKALYQRGLEREADSGGLNYWVGRVAADGKAAVLAEISESAEHFQLLQDQITTPVILDRYTIPGV